MCKVIFRNLRTLYRLRKLVRKHYRFLLIIFVLILADEPQHIQQFRDIIVSYIKSADCETPAWYMLKLFFIAANRRLI